MKIVFIITGLTMGGAETQVCTLADKLSSEGHSVSIVVLAGDTLVKPRSSLIQIYNMEMRKHPLSFILTLLKTSKLLKRLKPDVVHSHMVHANIFARFLRIITKFPKLISTAHSSNDGGIFRVMMYRLTHCLADLTTNVSLGAVRVFESKGSVPKGGMLVQYNGVDGKFFNSLDSRSQICDELSIDISTTILLSVGRMTEAKDYPNLLSAFSKLQLQNVILLIAGNGELESEIKQLSLDLKLQDKIKFLGVRSDIPELMNSADMLILSSAWEGFPMVIGEAMASGCLVVSTNAGGAKEWFPSELEHLVVPTKSPNLLSKKIDEILNLKNSLKSDMICKAKDHVNSNFSLDKISKDWLQLYKKD